MKALTAQFEDRTVGSEDLQTGLMIMTKRLDTGSPWPVMNNPRGRYFDPVVKKGKTVPDKDFLLRDVVRASTAASLFRSRTIENIQRGRRDVCRRGVC